MHILNETRITAGVLYETQSPEAYANVTKQLMYCDLRLDKLYEYIDSHPKIKGFRQEIEGYETLYAQWSAALRAIDGRYDLAAGLSAEDRMNFIQEAVEWRKLNLRDHEILSNTTADIVAASNEEVLATKGFNWVTLWVVLVVSGVSLVVTIGLALFLVRSITRPLGDMRDVLHQIGTTGDLQIPQERQEQLREVAKGKDETAQCSRALLVLLNRLYRVDENLSHVADGNLTVSVDLQSQQDTMGLAVEKLLHNLNQKFGGITHSTFSVNQKAAELSRGSQHLAEGAQRQAESVSQLAESVKRVTEKAEQSASRAQQTLGLVRKIQDTAKVGSEKMTQMMQAAETINTSSRSIGKVIKVIDEIAFQTNLLALNASVEASRAGVHGKGFAVVAQEVRNLAAKSAEAARESGVLIDDTVQKAALGTSIAQATARSLEEIVTGVEESSIMIQDIAALSQEQEIDIQGIIDHVVRVESIVRQNNTIAAHSADAAEEISRHSNRQTELVRQFHLLQQDADGVRGGALV